MELDNSLRKMVLTMIDRGIIAQTDVIKNTPVSGDKFRAFLGKGNKTTSTGDYSLENLSHILRYMENVIEENSGRKPISLDVYQAREEVERVLSRNVTGASGLPLDFRDFLELSRPHKLDRDGIEGNYLSFRRQHGSSLVVVSAINVSVDEKIDAIVWNNVHPGVESNVSFSGLVLVLDLFYVFVGQRVDKRWINVFSVRRPVNLNHPTRHGVALVETQDVPNAARLCLVRKTSENFEHLTSLIGFKSIDDCRKLGLGNNKHIDTLEGGFGNNLDNSRSIAPLLY
jgi:hypothetical protein